MFVCAKSIRFFLLFHKKNLFSLCFLLCQIMPSLKFKWLNCKFKLKQAFPFPHDVVSPGITWFFVSGEILWSGFLFNAIPRAAQCNQMNVGETSPWCTTLCHLCCPWHGGTHVNILSIELKWKLQRNVHFCFLKKIWNCFCFMVLHLNTFVSGVVLLLMYVV